MLVPEQIEGVKNWLASSKQEVAELGLTVQVEADDFPVQHAAAAPQLARQSFAQAGKAFECISISRDEPNVVFVRIKQRAEPVPLDLENPSTSENGAPILLRGNGWKIGVSTEI
jgi:hypothetical protein